MRAISTRNVAYYLAGIISLAVVAVYLGALRNDFVNWDDDVYIINNIHLRTLDWGFLGWAFGHFYAANWHPLTWISHGLDYAVWGLDPVGHHLTSIVIHGINTFVVVLLIITVLRAAAEADIRLKGRTSLDQRIIFIAAATTGALFGIHPVHVESVAWVAERKDLLCGLFFLVSILAYAGAVRDMLQDVGQDGAIGRLPNTRYGAVLVLFVLALLSKPMAVTLPVVLLILDWYPFRRIRSLPSFRAVFIEKIPFFVLSLGSSAVTILAQKAGGSLTPLDMYPLSTRVLVAFQSIIAYLGKMLFPAELIPYYVYPTDATLLSLSYLVPLLAAAGITIICAAVAKNHPLYLAAWGWYVIMLLPVLGIIQVGNQAMADRYTYLPSLGPFIVLGIAAGRIGMAVHSWQTWRSAGKVAISLAAALLLLITMSLTRKQISVWRNNTSLWSYVIEKDPYRVPLAYNNRGLAYQEAGQADLALSDFTTAITLDPSQYAAYLAYVNRGLLFKDLGQTYRALGDYDMAIILNPNHANAYYNRGWMFAETGQIDRAIEDYTKAIELDPAYSQAYNNRGVALEDTYQFDRALADYDKAISLNPYDYLAFGNRGMVLSRMGRHEEAIESYTRAIALKPDFIKAYRVRGELYAAIGKPDLAEQDFAKARVLQDEADKHRRASGAR